MFRLASTRVLRTVASRATQANGFVRNQPVAVRFGKSVVPKCCMSMNLPIHFLKLTSFLF